MKKSAPKPASKDFTAKVNSLGDWRGPIYAHCRDLIHQADPEIVEEVKWKKPSNPTGTPLFSHDGMVCTLEAYKLYVKMTFAKGASLPDPTGLFNAPFTGNVRRAIDLREGDTLNEKAFKALVRDAVDLNKSSVAAKAAKKKSTKK